MTYGLVIPKGEATRGQDKNQGFMFTYLSLEQRFPKDHPLRTIKTFADTVLKEMNPIFYTMTARWHVRQFPGARGTVGIF